MCFLTFTGKRWFGVDLVQLDEPIDKMIRVVENKKKGVCLPTELEVTYV